MPSYWVCMYMRWMGGWMSSDRKKEKMKIQVVVLVDVRDGGLRKKRKKLTEEPQFFWPNFQCLLFICLQFKPSWKSQAERRRRRIHNSAMLYQILLFLSQSPGVENFSKKKKKKKIKNPPKKEKIGILGGSGLGKNKIKTAIFFFTNGVESDRVRQLIVASAKSSRRRAHTLLDHLL